jgi:hypothetical protein
MPLPAPDDCALMGALLHRMDRLSSPDVSDDDRVLHLADAEALWAEISASPAPYSEANPPKVRDGVLFCGEVYIVLLVPPDTVDGIARVQGMLTTQALPINRLTFLFRPKEQP